jgi:hypothetical protein
MPAGRAVTFPVACCREFSYLFMRRKPVNFMRRNLRNIWFIFFLFILLGLAPVSVYAEDTCVECHKDDKYLVQNKKLYDYYKNWKDSTHDIAGVKCVDCHGGDPKKADKDASHKKSFLTFRTDEKESTKKIPLICGRCHKEVLKHFMTSKHYKAIREKETGPNCVTCHGAMNVGIYQVSEISKACGECHNEETKSLPEIGKVAEDVLHNINILRVYREWLASHSIFDGEKRKKLVALYQDIVFSWHTYNFEQIEARVEKPLNKSRYFIKEILADSRKKKNKKE